MLWISGERDCQIGKFRIAVSWAQRFAGKGIRASERTKERKTSWIKSSGGFRRTRKGPIKLDKKVYQDDKSAMNQAFKALMLCVHPFKFIRQRKNFSGWPLIQTKRDHRGRFLQSPTVGCDHIFEDARWTLSNGQAFWRSDSEKSKISGLKHIVSIGPCPTKKENNKTHHWNRISNKKW